MHLPAIHSDEWAIDYTRDAVSHGDAVYYAPEGTVHAVTNVSRSLMSLRNLSDNSTWTVERDDVTDSLYRDFFPVE